MEKEEKNESYQEKIDGLLDFVVKELKIGKQITEAKVNGIKYKITEAFLLIVKLCGKIETITPIATYANVTKHGTGKNTYPINHSKP